MTPADGQPQPPDQPPNDGATPDVMRLLLGGKLEQTCPACGRWEAAHWYCSWCWSKTGPADWYRNYDFAERNARRPAEPPDKPPSEYRETPARWPKEWKACPPPIGNRYSDPPQSDLSRRRLPNDRDW